MITLFADVDSRHAVWTCDVTRRSIRLGNGLREHHIGSNIWFDIDWNIVPSISTTGQGRTVIDWNRTADDERDDEQCFHFFSFLGIGQNLTAAFARQSALLTSEA